LRRYTKPTNAFERGVVLDVLRGLVARGAPAGGCAVLSPYNAQVDALARDLKATGAAPAASVGAGAVLGGGGGGSSGGGGGGVDGFSSGEVGQCRLSL
jgi:hypothetical protein